MGQGGGAEGAGLESAGLHAEPGQQPLFAGCTRFRPRGKANSKFAPAHGENSARHRKGEGEPPASATRSHGDSD